MINYLIAKKYYPGISGFFQEDDLCLLFVSQDKKGKIIKYDPCNRWDQAGPVITHARVSMDYMEDYDWSCYTQDESGSYRFSKDTNPIRGAMRALALSVYGETAELQDEEILSSVSDYPEVIYQDAEN